MALNTQEIRRMQHFSRRADQRYKLGFNQEELGELLGMVRRNDRNVQFLREEPGTGGARILMKVYYKLRWILIIYDRWANMIITALTPRPRWSRA